MKLNALLMSFLLSSFFSTMTWATPYPGMGSSILVNPEVGAYLTAKGYRLKTEGTSWIPVADLNESIFDSLRFQMRGALGGKKASLSLRVDETASSVKLDLYAKKWIKEYSQFGFEILGSKPVSLAESEALVIDLVQKNQAQQIRQVLIQKNKKVAVFTCKDSKDNFNVTLAACNQVVRSFEWSEIK